MYKVTGIKKITNKRYLVEIDEYIRFPLYISELKRNGIEVDKVIETDKVEMIMKKTLLPRCRERVFYILKDSDKSEFDVRRKLADNFYPAEIIDIVINEMLEKGQNVLLEIEVQGAKQVMEKCPEAITIFMVPPSLEELEARIRGRRSEPEDIVQQRLSKARSEMELRKNYKYVVTNDTVENASQAIIDIINGVNLKQD